MATSEVVTHFSNLLSLGQRQLVVDAVAQWPVIRASEVSMYPEEDERLLGTVVHVSKAKKVTVGSKNSVDKKAKRELPYHRLVFVR